MFRFTIRDVLWAMVVVGLSMAWWVDHQRLAYPWANWNERLIEEVKKTCGESSAPATLNPMTN